MPQPIISVEKLSKRYQIATRESYYSLRDAISDAFLLKKRFQKQPKTEDFWALRDINFEIQPGESMGIIGRNGAGKSTLLKILSQINPPTIGKIVMRGRVASLLEVGTGFHPELTGRENIYLNGAILGMTRREVGRQFDSIVSFAEVEKFLDTPVKRYSSGMYVRLAFAVAAHLEPEILIVDEVLAVGDIQFQKKCLGKMQEVGKGGRTIIFVSHNLSAVKNLCNRSILLDKGRIKSVGKTGDIIAQYVQEEAGKKIHYPIVKGEVTVHRFQTSQRDEENNQYDSGRNIDIAVDFSLEQDLNAFRIGIFIKSPNGDLITRGLLADWQSDKETVSKGRYHLTGQIPANLLNSGKYLIELHSSRFGVIDYNFNDVISQQITITTPHNYNENHRDEISYGLILIDPKWQLKKK